MSGSVTLSMQQAAEQLAASEQAAAAAASSSSSSSGTSTTANALQELGSNFSQFLSLLLTQVQNQDPTSPMDTDQFTQELVEFTGVQQSVATNTNLTTLIGLQQGDALLQSGGDVGDTATVTSNQIALQNGTGEISYSLAAAAPVQIAILDSSGAPIYDASVSGQAGANTWTWNGTNNAGETVPDGAYTIALVSGAASSAISFSVLGTVTGSANTASGMQLDIGALSVPLTSVVSLAKPTSQ